MTPLPCSGRCLCGAVTFTGTLESDAVIACHCDQCRASSGHFWASAHLLTEGISITDTALRWFDSSPGIQRGFCGTCGSFLFWRREGAAYWAVSAGALPRDLPLRTTAHIFLASKPGYYATPADAPGYALWPEA